jgi:hypothetical protein
MVDQIVGDLEGETDIAGIAAQRGTRFGWNAAHDGRGLDREFDQRAGLQLLEPGDRGEVEHFALCREIHHLAAGHARRS